MIEGEDRYETLVRQGLGQVTGFEPNSKNLKLLNARQGPYRYLPHFLGDGEMATFHLTRYPGCASLLQPDEEIINLFSSIGAEPGSGNFAVTKTVEVETVRLDDISDLTLPDYVKIDVQGAELLVMENALDTFSDVLVVETEVEFVPIYKDQPLFGDIQLFFQAWFYVTQTRRCRRKTITPAYPRQPFSGNEPSPMGRCDICRGLYEFICIFR